ncbi:hypothetical protein [Pseudobutyrivibrio ruminis]|uniref:Uncharacterized protein n=1 Tax=Pseudobutyrivibrio ruminis DSM 9787 TaxID=1123011 RepID=A0A285S8Y6_9FIRM|nr:hypothetical protein [Pseudobutyrivibrio ruminis]SOC03927.1 hypothetical protein SAMN02910411_1975 [Pseudobutyrivibrio ruminis DSM 9787]
MKVKMWLIGWFVIVITTLSIMGFWVYRIDPFFHYHKPNVDEYYYPLNNERSQNDGISKHFDYNALITGTSMTENFRVTEADEIFGCNFIKVAYSGGSYKEINDNLKNALESNKDLKLVIRCLDMGKFLDGYDDMRPDLGEYPSYLYDNNPFNDVEYLLNRDVIFNRVYPMTLDNDKEGFVSGITSFDDYSRWQSECSFGINTVSPNGIIETKTEQIHLSDEERKTIKKNITMNVTMLADDYPEVDFYYFYSPYSVARWNEWNEGGTLYKMLEAEEYITELIVTHKNIHLFSFNNRTDITTDLNNYKDGSHYACWINSLMLKWMHDGLYRLTEDNYKSYLKQEKDFYTSFDYKSVNGQVDYEADFYAAALLNKELTGVEPLDVLNDDNLDVFTNGADWIKDNNGRNTIIDCKGTLDRDYATEDLADYIRDKEYIGVKFKVNMNDGYNYLSFYGRKTVGQGMPVVYVYNKDGDLVGNFAADYSTIDNEVHQYVMDLSTVTGEVTIVMNGGYIDDTGDSDSGFQFSEIYMY